jgi:hypothetical protein
MFSALKRLATPPFAEAVDIAYGAIARKAAICEGIFSTARELALRGAYGPPLNQLVARASGLLDDIDDELVALDPVRHAPAFAVAAGLQRQLERIQAAIADRRRASTYASTSCDAR